MSIFKLILGSRSRTDSSPSKLSSSSRLSPPLLFFRLPLFFRPPRGITASTAFSIFLATSTSTFPPRWNGFASRGARVINFVPSYDLPFLSAIDNVMRKRSAETYDCAMATVRLFRRICIELRREPRRENFIFSYTFPVSARRRCFPVSASTCPIREKLFPRYQRTYDNFISPINSMFREASRYSYFVSLGGN